MLSYLPQLPTLVTAPPEGDGWLHELKHDGYRMGIVLEDGRARIESRRGLDLRQHVESSNAALEGSLENFLLNRTLTRVFSMRQEFSSAFNRLCQAPVGTPVTFDITDRHFPLFPQGRPLTAPSANPVLAVEDRANALGAIAISMNGTAAANFSSAVNPTDAGDPFGGLPVKPIAGAFAGGIKRQHTVVLDNTGNLAPANGGGAPYCPAMLGVVVV